MHKIRQLGRFWGAKLTQLCPNLNLVALHFFCHLSVLLLESAAVLACKIWGVAAYRFGRSSRCLHSPGALPPKLYQIQRLMVGPCASKISAMLSKGSGSTLSYDTDSALAASGSKARLTCIENPAAITSTCFGIV